MRLEELVQGLPRTKSLYLSDSYLSDFIATTLRAELEGTRNIYLILDATAFHPKSGGQPSDTGFLSGRGFEVHVKKAMILRNIVVHWGTAEGKLVASVSGKIDWKPRYLYMRRHTGGHLLDHCLNEVTGKWVETTDSWLGEGCYVAYKGNAPSEDTILKAVDLENEMIQRGGVVHIDEVTWDRLLQMAPNAPNLQRLPRLERYRVVNIEGCIPIPCAGTHIRDIKEIGKVGLMKVEQLEDSFRVYYDVEH